MVALAIEREPAFALSRIELERDGPSYAVDTVAGMILKCQKDDGYINTQVRPLFAIRPGATGDITTHSFLGEVIDQAQLDMTTDDLLDGKTVFVKDEAADFTIMVAVRDPSEQVAIEIVNTIADLFKEKRDAWNGLQDKRDRIDVEIRDWARYASPYSPKTQINVAAGGVLGALIGVVIVFVLEWLEAGVVRSTEDINRLDIPALGAIPSQSGWRR